MYSVIALLALAGSVIAQGTNCDAQYDTCRTTPVQGLSANQAQCAAEYAACLGYNPFTGGAPSSTASRSRAAYSTGYGTGTVTVFTTVCPTPTTFVCGGSTYAVSKSTTLTISCPGGCAITTPIVYTAPPAPTTTTAMAPGTTTANGTPATTTPKYTGAADKLQIGGALVAAAVGALVL
ncbi:hypothetical protein AMS68_000664 [Peltaster fructicola]|uniref:Uncharacterized protein n=1 Tax=Peltaster fructicola TaxID=286661 RepID=A0A6H0XK80_9PEZI|nr:hypothetical protein AMS68_000664 [Peltaster fructicola]